MTGILCTAREAWLLDQSLRKSGLIDPGFLCAVVKLFNQPCHRILVCGPLREGFAVLMNAPPPISVSADSHVWPRSRNHAPADHDRIFVYAAGAKGSGYG